MTDLSKVGFAIGICSFASGVATAGYSGACRCLSQTSYAKTNTQVAMNPARCLGLMAPAG